MIRIFQRGKGKEMMSWLQEVEEWLKRPLDIRALKLTNMMIDRTETEIPRVPINFEFLLVWLVDRINHRLHKFRKLRLEKCYNKHYLCNPLYLQICLIRLPLKFSTHFWILYVILGVWVSFTSNLLDKYTDKNSNYKEGATTSFNTTEPKGKWLR